MPSAARSSRSASATAKCCCCAMRGSAIRRLPHAPASLSVPSARRCAGRGSVCWRPMRPWRKPMRHVDEGTIHAWLDRQVIDPQEVAWITTHLRECAACTARVAEEEATLRDAESLLASVAPAADGSRAAFEALVATAKQKTAGQQSGAGAPDASNRVLPFGRWMAPASLAAMIALAIGLGWMARQMTSPRGTVTPASAPPMAQHRAEPAAVPPDAVPPDTAPPLVNPERRQQETTALEPGRKVVEPQKPSSGTLATPAEESARVASASQTRATRAEAADGGGQAVTPLVPAAPP